MDIIVVILKAFGVALGVATGIMLAPAAAFALFVLGLCLLYFLAWCGDQVQDWWRRTWH